MIIIKYARVDMPFVQTAEFSSIDEAIMFYEMIAKVAGIKMWSPKPVK